MAARRASHAEAPHNYSLGAGFRHQSFADKVSDFGRRVIHRPSRPHRATHQYLAGRPGCSDILCRQPRKANSCASRNWISDRESLAQYNFDRIKSSALLSYIQTNRRLLASPRMATSTAAPIIAQTTGKVVRPISIEKIIGRSNCLTAQLPIKAPIKPRAIEVMHPR